MLIILNLGIYFLVVRPIAGLLIDRAAKLAQIPDELYAQVANQITSERERQQSLATRR